MTGGSNETKKINIGEEEWQCRRDQVPVSKEHLDMLVLNFLQTEGFQDAAQTFQQESGMRAAEAEPAAAERADVRSSIEQGNVMAAVEQVNDIHPEILEEDAALLFHVQRQHLIELIRQRNTEEALAFAQEFLAYKGEADDTLLDELESAVALLAFEDPSKCPVQELLSNAQRQETAREVNRAILKKLSQDEEPKLAMVLKLLNWGQEKLKHLAEFPEVDPFALPPLEDDADGNVAEGE